MVSGWRGLWNLGNGEFSERVKERTVGEGELSEGEEIKEDESIVVGIEGTLVLGTGHSHSLLHWRAWWRRRV